MTDDGRILLVLGFFLGLVIGASLSYLFADATSDQYYTYKGNGLFVWNNQIFDAKEDCTYLSYTYKACQQTKIILLQNEKIITLLEEIKNATRG